MPNSGSSVGRFTGGAIPLQISGDSLWPLSSGPLVPIPCHTVPMAPIVRVFISPEEVYPGRVVTYEELSRRASDLNRSAALEFLGFMNLLLSSATLETTFSKRIEPLRDVQTWLIREVISRDLLAALQFKFGNTSLLNRPLLHRSQLLFVTRLIATHGLAAGGNTLTTRDDFDVIGDLLFLANGLYRPAPPPSTKSTALWIATQMGPLHETENPPDLWLSWPRVQELLARRLPAVSPDTDELERLERVAVFNSGFSLQAWLDLSFLLFSFWSQVTFRDLMADRSMGYLDPRRPHEVVSTEVLARAVEGLACRFEELPEQLEIQTFSSSCLFDLTPFRAKPLWIMPNGYVLCVDAAFLTERLGPHIFWGVVNALDTAQRRKQFAATWGLAFEKYCLDAFQGVFAGKKWTYYRNPIDESTHEEIWDGLAVREDVAIVIECKGTFVRSAEKYSGMPRLFFKGLSKRFGRVRHGGIYQLARGISRVWFEGTARSPIARPETVMNVFPILVVHDPILDCGPVARVVSDRFLVSVERFRRDGRRVPRIWPLTVMTADDVDRVTAAVQVSGARLDAFLKGFHRTHPSRMSRLADFFSTHAPAYFGPQARADEAMRGRFKASADSTLRRFRESDYGGAPEDPRASSEAGVT